MTGIYDDGYYAGLVNDRECPHPSWTLAWVEWNVGNLVGLDAHCALVESVYLRFQAED